MLRDTNFYWEGGLRAGIQRECIGVHMRCFNGRKV